MKIFLRFSEIGQHTSSQVGGKALSLARLKAHGFSVPEGGCIPVSAYREFVDSTGLHERIMLEMNRKKFEDMRWEEIWDVSLRIRSMFLKTHLPNRLERELRTNISSVFSDTPLVIRSSAPGEDTKRASFAGLHESYVNVRGVESSLKHIKLVWASLWSNRALLYRKELGLEVGTSEMAVVIQELVSGERSGIIFGKNPLDRSQMVIESVYGLNQGLVDGTVQPDRWILNRETGEVKSHTPAKKTSFLVPADEGTELRTIGEKDAHNAPLTQDRIHTLFTTAKRFEDILGGPQDIEWTMKDHLLFILQSRPITSKRTKDKDRRQYYFGLQQNFSELAQLREKIEHTFIPEMIKTADHLGAVKLSSLANADLADEIEKRTETFTSWVNVYWEHFIPFAHGIRLFGQLYNDTLLPEDPYEFVELLRTRDLESLKRNSLLEEMADMVRKDHSLLAPLQRGVLPRENPELASRFERFMHTYGNVFLKSEKKTLQLLAEISQRPSPQNTASGKTYASEERFLSRFPKKSLKFARDALDLARASYRLRDDDNIYLGKIEKAMADAVEEGRGRVSSEAKKPAPLETDEILHALRDETYTPQTGSSTAHTRASHGVRVRQLRGQPASQGIASGKARVIEDMEDLFGFKAGEILVIDAVDPNTTFVVPLAAGIVERRGGMLIHGAIIAREYGIPCITGIPEATDLIESGDRLTVDGFLGIVTIGK